MTPESLWEVSVHDGVIVVQNPQGEIETLPIANVISVKIETDDSGPWESDVWWLISSTDDALVFPSGATGEKTVLEALQLLPGFDNDAVTRAMSCTEPRTFVCF